MQPKGADRKHKTDREKMLKRPQSEQVREAYYRTSVGSKPVVVSVVQSWTVVLKGRKFLS